MNALKIEQSSNIGMLLLRSTIGILILFHGIANLNSNYAFIKQLLEGYQIPDFLAYGVFIGEVIAPILIIIGYKTRLNSLIIAFNFLTAIVLAHSSDILSLNQFGGWGIELQALYLFGATTLFFIGAGRYAVSIHSKWD
ncbi:DoxX family protein [Aquimarina mytili]|uniref:DoxX family protein n=1 Tax=Aquimarina mytili TaxID=874423 RepID=A0A937A6L9_9FLAO|nr:DoxX family protein [Aquimarina mytili]MBL0685234.1 DoxX family protein [Aquimarina mytili]